MKGTYNLYVTNIAPSSFGRCGEKSQTVGEVCYAAVVRSPS